MPTLHVDTLRFDFDANVTAQHYDQSQHYTGVWNAPPGGRKAVDVVAVEGSTELVAAWLIEAKDFRVITHPPRPSNIGGLAQAVADKANDTLAGLADASTHATRRVVLHLEPHTGAHSALFPSGFAASVLQQLRRLVKAIDANPLVLNISNTPSSGVPWSVS